MNFALAGNPNCGKTTLFNALTGSTAHVGNWPGVTVDKKEGTYKKLKEKVNIVDLPGIYSLSPYTPEEVISRNYIIDEKPDCVINIVDATNLERNLYLTTQLLETDVPVVVALNMMDTVRAEGDSIDSGMLAKALGVPVVEISALKQSGVQKLMEVAYAAAKKPRKGTTVMQETATMSAINAIKSELESKKVASPLFHAIKLLEGDELEVKEHADLSEKAEAVKKSLPPDDFDGDYEAIVADQRYKYISAHYSEALKKAKKKENLTKSDKADKVLTHRIWGIPLFVVILFAVFHLTFSEDFLFISTIVGWFNGGEGLPTLEALGYLNEDGEPLHFGIQILACLYDGAVFSPGVIINNIWNDLIVGNIFGLIAGWVENIPAEWAVGLINDGIIEGIAAVLSFLPQILVLFLFFSILEDTGYMARVAFILDRIFRKFGLSGRAFMPMIMGFGCSIPAMVNTRTLADEKERIATVRVIPFFSCGAKLPILLAISGGILGYYGVAGVDLITFLMYFGGIATAIIAVIVMRGTTMKGEVPPFIMELPAYHVPGFKNLMLHLWDKCKHFIKKAFTIIFASTIVIWFFSHFSWDWRMLGDEEMNQSILASLGMLIQPLFTPLGFGSQLGRTAGWVFAVAAITGLIAKENVIATFASLAACLMSLPEIAGVISGTDYESIAEGATSAVSMIEATGIDIPGLLAFIMFNMTTIPCFAACATAKAELPEGKFKWTVLFWVVTSYVTGVLVYLTGLWMFAMIPSGTAATVLTVFIAIVIAAALTAAVLLLIRYLDNRKKAKAV